MLAFFNRFQSLLHWINVMQNSVHGNTGTLKMHTRRSVIKLNFISDHEQNWQFLLAYEISEGSLRRQVRGNDLSDPGKFWAFDKETGSLIEIFITWIVYKIYEIHF